MRLVWLKDSRSIPDNSRDKRTQITTTVDEESLTVTSTLHLQSLTLADQGSYVCNISRPGGYERLGTAQLHVLNPNAKICKAETARGNRGEFHWHDTVAGAVAYIPCPNGHFKPWRESWKVGTARRTCASDGVWMDAQYGDCAYESPVTQRLHYLSTVSGALLGWYLTWCFTRSNAEGMPLTAAPWARASLRPSDTTRSASSPARLWALQSPVDFWCDFWCGFWCDFWCDFAYNRPSAGACSRNAATKSRKVSPRQNEDALWRQHCVLRCCPLWQNAATLLRAARTQEMFLKIFRNISCV